MKLLEDRLKTAGHRRSPGKWRERLSTWLSQRHILAGSLLVCLVPFVSCPVFCAGSGSIEAATHPSEIVFPNLEFVPPRPERIEMENGMVVFLLPDQTVPLIRAVALIRAGALCESSEEQGLSSLTANVMRLGGTVQVSATEMNQQLEYVGASLESGSARDYSSVSLRVLTKDRDLGFGLMADLLQNPAFPQDKIDQRKGETLEALKRQNDDPMEITRREFRRLLYGDHPYGRDPLGTPETLAGFDREDLVAWHSKWYHPSRTVFAVSGDFEREWMVEQIREMFGERPDSSGEFAYPEVVPQGNDGRRFFIEKDLNQSTIRIGHLGIRKDNPDALPLEILNYIIGGGGFTSRLVSKVRTESGFAYLVGSVFDEPLQTGQFLAVLQTQTKNAVNAMRLTMDVIKDTVENENITQEELVQAKESKLNEFVFKFETPYDVVRQYAELEYYSLPLDYLETYRDRLAAITREDLARVGKKYIATSAMTVLVLGHKDARPDLEELGEVEDIQLEGSGETALGNR